MKAKWKAKWLTALRSGEYKQGRQRLKQQGSGEPRFCCLGVLCDLYDSSKWQTNRIDGTMKVSAYAIFNETRTGVLPEALREITGLTDPETTRLMDMNDNGVPFAQIADYIEERL